MYLVVLSDRLVVLLGFISGLMILLRVLPTRIAVVGMISKKKAKRTLITLNFRIYFHAYRVLIELSVVVTKLGVLRSLHEYRPLIYRTHS